MLSDAKPAPKNPAKTKTGSKKAPSKSAPTPLYGNKDKKCSERFKFIGSDSFSTEMGMRGNFMIRAETMPIKVVMSVIPAPVMRVKRPVRSSFRVSRSLVTAIVMLKKRTGSKKYRPIRTVSSAQNLKKALS